MQFIPGPVECDSATANKESDNLVMKQQPTTTSQRIVYTINFLTTLRLPGLLQVHLSQHLLCKLHSLDIFAHNRIRSRGCRAGQNVVQRRRRAFAARAMQAGMPDNQPGSHFDSRDGLPIPVISRPQRPITSLAVFDRRANNHSERSCQECTADCVRNDLPGFLCHHSSTCISVSNPELPVRLSSSKFVKQCKKNIDRSALITLTDSKIGLNHTDTRFGCINVRSLNSKFDDVIELFADFSLLVLCLTETWLDVDSAVVGRFRALGYSVIDRPRPRTRDDLGVNHGGVAVIAAPGATASPIPTGTTSPKTFEVTAAYIAVRRCRVAVVVIYRPGSQPVTSEFFDELLVLLESLAVIDAPLYITGDFNIRLDRADDPHTIQLRSTFDAYGFRVSESGPTHRCGGVLDVVAARSTVLISTHDVDISDHVLLTWPVDCERPVVPPTATSIRPWRRLDMAEFRAALLACPLCEPQLWPQDADCAANLYDDVINSLLDRLLPVTVHLRRQRPSDPWFDSDCRSSKRLTRRLERAASTARRRVGESAEAVAAAAAAELAWRQQRASYRRLRHQKSLEFWSAELSTHREPHRIWSTIDRLLGRGRRPCTSVDADSLCDFFVRKVDRVRASTSDSPSPTYSTVPGDASLLAFVNLDVADVGAAIHRLPNKSSSADPLPAFILKEVADVLSPFLAHLFNRSIDTGCFPKCFKIASLTPILKKQGLPEDDPASYRPISNLSIISKLLERLIATQFVRYVEGHKLLPAGQSGFRRGFSTETATTKVLSDLLDAVDRGDTAVLALLDLSAAFDTVDHDILLQRLSKSFGVRGRALEWFRSYLSCRRQYVRCRDVSSAMVDVLCGVPQGSVLGPILFILYTADLPSVIIPHGLSVHQYADDSQIYGACHPNSTSALADALSRCTTDVDNWMRSNRLQLNADKTDVMWCATARRSSRLPADPLSIANTLVQPVSAVRDLGILIDSDLGAASHVRMIVSRCFAALRQLRHLRRYVSNDCFRSLVVALVHSRLDYGNFIMVGLPAYRLRMLQSVLNAAARLTYGLRRYDHVSGALAELHWLRVPERVDFKLAVMTYCSLHGLSPPYLHVFQRVADIAARRRLRSSATDSVVVPAYRLATIGRRSFPVAGALLWNSLPTDIQSSPSLTVFRSRLKTYLFRKSFPDV